MMGKGRQAKAGTRPQSNRVKSRLRKAFALALGGCLVGVGLLLPFLQHDARAACNSVGGNRFEVTPLAIKAFACDSECAVAGLNKDVKFEVKFTTTLASGDSATFSCVWSGDVSSTVSHPVQTGENTLTLTKSFDTTGTKNVTFWYYGPNWPGESCTGSVSKSIIVAKVEIKPVAPDTALDYLCVGGPHDTHKVQIDVTPDSVGTDAIKLELRKSSGSKGLANFQGGTSTKSISGDSTTPETIVGTEASDGADNMVLEAKIDPCTDVVASDNFTIMDLKDFTIKETLHTVNTVTATDNTEKDMYVCTPSDGGVDIELTSEWKPDGNDSSHVLWQPRLPMS